MDAHAVTVGVEEEFLLTDPGTGMPVAKNTAVARTAADAGVELQLELTRCQVETSTSVHTEIEKLLDELGSLRRDVAECARQNDAQLLAVAIPPTVPQDFPVTDTPRYRRISDTFGMLAHEQGLCGCHVHVGMPDRETALQVSNYVRAWLPTYLALTANSPIYRGTETGYASWRSVLWRRWPSAGPPPYFESEADYDAMVEMMVASGCILDRKMVYWDIRPSESFPTLEIRVSDIPATVAETALLATLIRATAITALESLAHNRPAPAIPDEVLRAAYWNAARFGLDGNALDPIERRVVAAPEMLTRLLTHLHPALDELGATELVTDSLAQVLRDGNGAQRQLTALHTNGQIADVVTLLRDATVQGC